MDSIKSFKGYGKVDEAQDHEFRRKTRKRFIIIGVSSVLLLVIVIGIVLGVVVSRQNSDRSPTPTASSTSVSQSVKTVCSVTRYPESCYSSMLLAASANGITDPEALFKLSLQIVADGLEKAKSLPDKLADGVTDPKVKLALSDCTGLINDSVDLLNSSLSLVSPAPGANLLTQSKVDDLKTWLSATLTNHETCLDGLDGLSGGFRDKLEAILRNSTEFSSNSLAIAAKILGLLDSLGLPIHRKLLAATTTTSLPHWVESDRYRRRLLQNPSQLKPDVVVAQDGSGQFKTIAEALKLVPVKNKTQFVIYVKAGTYLENVYIDKKKWNVIMIGDGMDKTIVSGSSNFVDGTPTFQTATFVVEGQGFIAKGMGFYNTAGAAKHQAVAARVKADHAIFYQCAFDAYQDTLYTHSLRQFYRECDIRGTIDFIFGNAAVVFQKCTIRPRQSMPNQQNTITAQGKTDPNQNTGTTIQGCTISPFDKVTVPTYLGRPWKPYSTTVFMGSVIGAVVSPKGWLSWDGMTDPPSTILYAEYQNTGPGSNTAGRVTWAGYKPSLTSDEAQKFTVGPFLQGMDWLPSTGVSYTP